MSEATKQEGGKLFAEMRAENELKGSSIAAARGGSCANAHALSYPALSVSAATHSFAGMLIAFAFPLASIYVRLLSEFSSLDRPDFLL